MITPTLQQEITQLEANFCAALSDPAVSLFYVPSMILGLNQPTTSRHLKVLRERGLVYSVRTGAVVTCHLSNPKLIQALDIMRSIMRARLAHQANLINN